MAAQRMSEDGRVAGRGSWCCRGAGRSSSARRMRCSGSGSSATTRPSASWSAGTRASCSPSSGATPRRRRTPGTWCSGPSCGPSRPPAGPGAGAPQRRAVPALRRDRRGPRHLRERREGLFPPRRETPPRRARPGGPMSSCPAFEPLLLDRSSGTIDAAAADRLAAHLRTCAACRAEAAILDDVRTLVTLPPPSEAERAALAGLADTLRPGQLEPERRWRLSLRGGAAMAVGLAATAMLVVLAHPLVTRRPSHGSVPASSQARSESWNAPDPDELWEASDLEFDEVDAAEAAADELALAVDDGASAERCALIFHERKDPMKK